MLSSEIKEYGLDLGYQKVGIISIDSLSGYADEVVSRGEPYGEFVKKLTAPILKQMPEARSVIVMAWDYYTKKFPERLRQMIGKIYLARCYDPPEGTLAHARIQLMADFLERRGLRVRGDFHVPARWSAAQAGIASFGRNNFVYEEESGSYVVLHTLVVDAPLEYDQPTMECKCPPHCRACIDACPTGALYEPFRLDPRKCIAYQNWMTQGHDEVPPPDIPEPLRRSIGCKIHGCDICQDVCPRNGKKQREVKTEDAYIRHIAPDFTLPAILNMTDEYYERRIKPILYNYIGDKRFFIRNAAIAMGNSKDDCFIDDLILAFDHPEAMIRAYVAWALGEIGGSRAKQALCVHLNGESSETVRQAVLRAIRNAS